MSQIILHECDICKFVSKSAKDWFEFEYDYVDISNKRKSLDFNVCSFKCYIVLLGRCLEWANDHGDVLIAGMSKRFAKEILKGVDVKKIEESLPLLIANNEKNKDKIRSSNSDDELEERFGEIKQKYQPTSNKLNKIIFQKISSNGTEYNWLVDFAKENCDERLMRRTTSLFENDNLITYDSLITQDLPKIPLIRYKDHYTIFIYENNQLKLQELCNTNLAK